MSYRFIDTHCHIHFPAYDQDRTEVLARLRSAGGAAILIGTSLANGRSAIQLAEQHPDLWATVGLHPSHVTHPHHDENEGAVEERDVTFEALKTLAEGSPKVVAIGEAGLDLYRVTPEEKADAFEKQRAVFETHLNVAEALDMPVVIHCREALKELAVLLKERREQGRYDRCILHSFTGTWAEAEPLLALGCYLSLNGIVTFSPRKNTPPEEWLEVVAKHVPLDHLLLETDSPYLAPMPYRGERNEPAWTEETGKFIAKLRGISEGELFEQVLKNTYTCFERLGR